MATKRAGGEVGGAPPAKKPSLARSTLDIGPAAGEEDLDVKVLQVQNRMLSERLRERNRSREQLEARVEKMEQDHESHLRLQGSIKQHLSGLQQRLLVAMATLGCEGQRVAEEGGVGGLETLTQSLNTCVEQLCKVSSSVKVCPAEATNEDPVRSRSLALLDEITKSQDKKQEARKLQEDLALLETKCEELQEQLADVKFSLEQSQTRGDRLETRLETSLAQLRSRLALQPQASEESTTTQQSGAEEGQEDGTTSTGSTGEVGGASAEVKGEDLEAVQGDLLESKELAQSRLEEIEKLSSQVTELKKLYDQLKLEQQQVSEAVVKESAVYKVLQGQFSVAALEAAQLRGHLDDAKAVLVSARQQHFTQLEEVRAGEMKYQQEVREEMNALETALAAVKHDYSLLRMEFERTVASNEQAAPIAKELRLTVDSLQKTITQHKSEVNRYKTRAHKAEQQLNKLQEEKDKEVKEKSVASADKDVTPDLSKAETTEPTEPKPDNIAELEKVRGELKAVQTELDALKQATSSEERERADIIAAEKKARGQVEELKKRFEDYRRDYEKRKEHIREEAARKAKSLSEDNRHLQKDLSAKKHEAQALVSEMEYATQAFEEMQEQNLRLLQQLKEKDDVNFKLMSERIKSNSVHKLLAEEKELLHSQLNAMAVERQRYSELISQLDERERTAEATIQGLDKELALQQQAGDSHRKKTEDSVKEVVQLQLQLTERQKLMQSVEQALSNRTDECERESQSCRKSVEEVASLKRKLEKYKSREWMTVGDEVLLEEIKIYKAKLNCPCCSTRKKDTVLTKCFHVFCSECIRNRYDSRLRKCPKCGAAFGANDFHKIYLS